MVNLAVRRLDSEGFWWVLIFGFVGKLESWFSLRGDSKRFLGVFFSFVLREGRKGRKCY